MTDHPLVPSGSTRKLSESEVLRTGRILARLRHRIDQMLDEVEECAKVLTDEGERVTVKDPALDLVERKMRRILS